MQPSIMVAAGGTGGHLFPAQALSEALIRRGYVIDLITDTRGGYFGADFPARNVYKVPAATFKGKSPIEATRTMATLSNGFQLAYKVMADAQPKAIIGFGGYPTLPPMLAAMARGVPSLIHEQNAVMGRANRFLAPMVKAIACSFENTKYLEGKLLTKAHLTGTPLRASVLQMRGQPYRPPSSSSQINLLIFGGSQGAQVFSNVMPEALSQLPTHMRERLMVVQQCRAEDIDRVFDQYEAAGVAAELSTFFENMAERMFQSHLVIARAGATTVSELCAVGRPALLVPLPHSLDNDQFENASRFQDGGGGWCLEQAGLTPERLAGTIRRLLEEPLTLVKAAAAATRMAQYNAVDNLADLLTHLAFTMPAPSAPVATAQPEAAQS
ncbi:MAG: undecaprenyldiphospho-muramoylpentapeptide beta-N-acetylglucosaminyltransferase [Hyphomicrobiales bacterium]|nr:undecaprenyldiphospho-muramoylpentapeptide beta-N-acetylglucosaminyltransferase [Hyphomicrobiales bacterium]